MNEHRNKLMRLVAVVNAAIAVEEIIPDEEIDRVWDMKYEAVVKEATEDGRFGKDATFGDLIDYLLKEPMEEGKVIGG